MKETTCALCGKKIDIDDETRYNQHILCPYCGGKFSYLAESAEFSPERLSYAIDECRKDNGSNRYYNLAPAGARLYIGLLFYGRVFKAEMDKDLYLAAMEKIEPQLKRRDWQYLVDNETDSELAAYFRDRLDASQSGPESEEIEMVAGNRQSATAAPSAAERLREAAAQRETRVWKQQLANRVVTTACLLAVLIVGYIIISHVLSSDPEQTPKPIIPKIEIPEPVDQGKPTTTTVPVRDSARAVRTTPIHGAATRPTDDAQRQGTQAKPKTPPPVSDERPVDDCCDAAQRAFANAGLQFWEDLKSRERPYDNSGTWYCAIPKTDSGFDMYKVDCTASSNAVWKLTRGKNPHETMPQEFEKDMQNRGALFANGQVAVIRGYGNMNPVGLAIPKKDETTSVGKAYFEKAYPCLCELKVDISSAMFKIELKRATTVLEVKDVGPDDEVGREPFAEAAHAFLLEEKRSRITEKDERIRTKIRPPKMTVVEYDGTIIKNGINGVTYVPKRFPYEDVEEKDMRCSGWWTDRRKCRCEGCKLRQKVASMRKLWTPLHEQAIEQAAAMEKYKIEVQREIERLREKVKVSPREINGFLLGARAYFRRLKNEARTEKRAVDSETDEAL